MKTIIWAGLFIGSTIGGFVPALWSESLFSMSSVLLSAIGGVVGIWAGVKIGRNMGL